MAKALRLTPPQVELLTDIATNPQMFISQYSRWDKTTRVLIRLGLADRTPGSAYNNQYEITITQAGRDEAVRRGIGGPRQEQAVAGSV